MYVHLYRETNCLTIQYEENSFKKRHIDTFPKVMKNYTYGAVSQYHISGFSSSSPKKFDYFLKNYVLSFHVRERKNLSTSL